MTKADCPYCGTLNVADMSRPAIVQSCEHLDSVTMDGAFMRFRPSLAVKEVRTRQVEK